MSNQENSSVMILLVEDQDDMAMLTSLYLQKAGFKVARAKHGKHALEMLASGTAPDLILLDVVMPVMDGYQFLNAANEEEAWSKIPVVMLTSLSDAKDVMKAVRGGAIDYCTKPIDPNDLLATISRLLGRVG